MKKDHPDKMDELKPAKTRMRKKAALPETKNWITTTCQHPECKVKNSYDTRDKYMQHLRVMHHIDAADAASFIPGRGKQENEGSDDHRSGVMSF